ncbi:MAG: twin-arginine translocase TatA/TatE family subunit [Candidatus Krumholzibacteriia bacterium]|nr:twin-arginine translocase TatA/TatE family subunit [bacterium]MCB9515014.1 twin-arginine translocase TatA/TatE family subunit [Candidatus Latescibacterota bacterium]
MFAFMGQWEIALVVLALLLLFGGRKIPELARGLGSGIREFRQGMSGKDENDQLPKGRGDGAGGPGSKD